MWWACLRGLESGHIAWICASAIFYAPALSCKEHVIMAPAVSVALFVLWWRTQGTNGSATLRTWLLRLTPVFLAYGLMGLFAMVQMKGILGKTYEPLAADTAAQVSSVRMDEG
jgi:hypothetical protein